ncbi:hypothetical protein PHYPSEUDO_000804 [Phytophthora pseudosyringae]|uniref:Uncharacterized protein n=1 Tax=Phytophthora pseudosyringae TaxID=221518 RepID=A0A8T1WG57_9STRA|nr:hypothetical protein PHYPSEUDO_000804 [Phytophthora pseudosyringae]
MGTLKWTSSVRRSLSNTKEAASRLPTSFSIGVIKSDSQVKLLTRPVSSKRTEPRIEKRQPSNLAAADVVALSEQVWERVEQCVLCDGYTGPGRSDDAAVGTSLHTLEVHAQVPVAERVQPPLPQKRVDAGHGAVGHVWGHGSSLKVKLHCQAVWTRKLGGGLVSTAEYAKVLDCDAGSECILQ